MIPLVKPYLPAKDILMPKLEKILYSGYIAEGETVKEFEQEFSRYINNPFSVSLNSGTAALHIALLLCNIQEGDEVISTVITAEPTNIAIKLTGAKVIWADVDPENGLLDPRSVESKITNRTKAIVVVHYAGMVADLTRLNEISQKYNIPLIEDAAHALGAKYDNKYIGEDSNFAIFSFQAIKHITTVDGGMLCLRDESYYKSAKLLRWFGLDKNKSRFENDISIPGYKYHMNNVNATIGLAQMLNIENVINRYVSNGIYYDQHLKEIAGLKLMKYYPKSEPSYWLYTVCVDNREDFIRCMSERGFMASELHKRNDLHSVFKESLVKLPNTDLFAAKMVHIPCGWWVGPEEREYIVDAIKKGW